MVVTAKIKNSKTIRIYAPSIETKWNAFHIHAKAQGKQPGHLLGEIFERYWIDNLEQINGDCQHHFNIEYQKSSAELGTLAHEMTDKLMEE